MSHLENIYLAHLCCDNSLPLRTEVNLGHINVKIKMTIFFLGFSMLY
jgi:hypothetical protein